MQNIILKPAVITGNHLLYLSPKQIIKTNLHAKN